MRYRIANMQDLDRIRTFYGELLDSSPKVGGFVRWVKDVYPADEDWIRYIDKKEMILLEDEEADFAIAAAMALTHSQGEEYHPVAWSVNVPDERVSVIHLLAVAPAYQGRGLASQLVDEAIRRAAANGKRALRLDAIDTNLPGQRLYEKKGFVRRDTAKLYYECVGWADFYFYEYLLPEQKYRIAIFDLDGTILNTLDDLAAATNFSLRAFELPERTTDEVRRFVGNGIGKLIERAVPAGSSAELMDRVHESFNDYYKKHCADCTRPYEGITDVIRELKDRGMRTAVVSNKADFAVQELCETYFPGLFDYCVGEREGVRRKPYPDSMLEVLRHFGLRREEAVYVGDSEVDVQTARNAGLDLITVLWGFRDEQMLRAEGATVLVSDMDELKRTLFSD